MYLAKYIYVYMQHKMFFLLFEETDQRNYAAIQSDFQSSTNKIAKVKK